MYLYSLSSPPISFPFSFSFFLFILFLFSLFLCVSSSGSVGQGGVSWDSGSISLLHARSWYQPKAQKILTKIGASGHHALIVTWPQRQVTMPWWSPDLEDRWSCHGHLTSTSDYVNITLPRSRQAIMSWSPHWKDGTNKIAPTRWHVIMWQRGYDTISWKPRLIPTFSHFVRLFCRWILQRRG